MSSAGIEFRDLLAYNHHETERWHKWFVEHPQALDVSVGGQTGTVRNLIKHIFQTESYFARRLNGEVPQLSSLETKSDSLDDIFILHEQAHGLMAHFISNASEQDWAKNHKFDFAGGFEATSRKMASQFFWHSINHWGQVAMVVRQGGFPGDGPHDIIVSPTMK